MFRSGALAAGATLALAASVALSAPTAVAAPPPPCNNAPQITDAATDGHHPPTDVLAAWWTEGAGRLQAVIRVYAGTPAAEHDEAETPGAGYAFVFTVGGQTRYVRATLPVNGAPTFDHGTYTPVGGFTGQGATTGVVETAANGTVTIDVPGAPAGASLTRAFVLTYDGINGSETTWVDHAPSGALPTDPAVGGDYVVGSCNATPPVGTVPAPTSVELKAPSKVTGRKTVTVTGRVLPAGTWPVVLTRTAGKQATPTNLTTAADGTFSTRVAIGETSDLRAVSLNVGSPELTVTARSTVRIKVRNRKDGSAVVTGTVDPKLPGRIQWLRTNAIKPAARTRTRSNGTFTLRLKKPKRGRYQVVFIPSGERAERSTSNTGVIR